MSVALNVVRLLRRLPHTARFDRHLDNCAAYEVLYRTSDPALPPLKITQALGLVPIGSFYTTEPDVMRKGVHLTVVSDNSRRSGVEYEPLDAA